MSPSPYGALTISDMTCLGLHVFLDHAHIVRTRRAYARAMDVIRMSISDAEEVVRMVKSEVTRADHQRLIDSVEGESSVPS